MQLTAEKSWQLLPTNATVRLTGGATASMVISHANLHGRGSYHADMLQAGISSMLL